MEGALTLLALAGVNAGMDLFPFWEGSLSSRGQEPFVMADLLHDPMHVLSVVEQMLTHFPPFLKALGS